jgi:short-subunit dehydrogenase
MGTGDLKSRYGSWGLVAGAAEGLGRAFSLNLAAEKINLILVDQQEELLESLARELEGDYGIRVKTLHLDLESAEAVEGMMELIREVNCRMIVYNAAFSRVQRFLQNDPAMLDRYIQVNMRTPMQLVHAFGRHYSTTGDLRKGILLMSSLAGSWGTQLLGPYGGTKAFNQILAESLHFEFKREGFDVTACIAGATATPGYLASLPYGEGGPGSAMKPDRVARAALGALGRRPFVVSGFWNKLVYFLMTRVLPRRVSLRIMNRAVGNRYRDKL